MEALPRERAGAGSALTNTARQVAVALSVAVLGSILSAAYRTSLNPTLDKLPAAVRSAAGSSITATQAVAAQLGHAGQFLLEPRRTPPSWTPCASPPASRRPWPSSAASR